MNIPSLKSKLPGTGETIFTEINTLAKKYDAVNLGQGFPDFDMSLELVDLVYAAMKHGHNQYAHMNGVPALRKALAEKAYNLYDVTFKEGIFKLYN